MSVFDRRMADFLQHIAVGLELTALWLIISDLRIHRCRAQ